jgi:hypothetical protein
MSAGETLYTGTELFFDLYGSKLLSLYDWDGGAEPITVNELYEAFKERMLSELKQQAAQQVRAPKL